MKIMFGTDNKGELVVNFVECDSIEEAQAFKDWIANANKPQVAQVLTITPPAPTPVVTSDVTPEMPHGPGIPTGSIPRKITRDDVSQAAIQLVQAKGRQAIDPILAGYGAKRISDIPDSQLYEALKLIKEAM